jgi:copper chaperone NosL
VVSAAALVISLFVPIWRIDLVAPQYPEGLYLLIHSNKLSGNVDIINGLNHYIGMKTLHEADFVEFSVLPYLIVLFAILFLTAAVVGKRKLLNIVFSLFLLFGVVAMVDFWKWEYNYGHELNPDAAIKVPGMTYQPPLIGYKQLLNFSAYSMPDVGGWLFVAAGVCALAAVFFTWKRHRLRKPQGKILMMAFAITMVMQLASCSISPEKIKVGTDHCSFCKMTISDVRYGAEILTKKGKVYKFDDVHCILSMLKGMPAEDIHDIYFTNFYGDHALINAKTAMFFKSDELNTPMGGNVAAISDDASLQRLSQQFKGAEVSWSELRKQ